MKTSKIVSLVMSFICLILFSYPSIASAHAYIIKSSPAANEVLTQTPKKVTIQFNETIQSNHLSIQVYDANGKRVNQKNGWLHPKNATILEGDVNPKLPNGTYRIQWKAVSSDGHPVEGVIPFQIGSGSGTIAPGGAAESKGYTPQFDLILIRWIQYVSNACYVGILFFYLVVVPKEFAANELVKRIFAKLVKISFAFLLLSILVSLPLMATIELSTSWSKVFTIQTFKDMLTGTAFGKTWFIQVAVLFLLAICNSFLSSKKSLLVWVAFLLGSGLLLTKALTSHAASAANPLVPIGLDFFHLLAASIWIGSLATLAALLPLSKKAETRNEYLKTVRRFFKWGVLLIVVLTVSGVVGSFSYIPTLRSFVYTDYGRVLYGKVILLGVMILFAAVNFFKGKRGNEKGLSSTILGELVTGLVVLVLSVVLTNLPTAMSAPGPINVTKLAAHGTRVTLHVTPNISGENSFEVILKDRNGQALSNSEQVSLTLTSLEMEMGEDTVTLSKVKEGHYQAKGMDFNMAGRWNVHVHVLTKDLETIDTDIPCIVGSL